MRTNRWVAGGAAMVMVAVGATLVSAANPAPERWAFVARGDNPIDALGAAPLAGTLDAPVILTEQTTLTADALAALRAVDPDNIVIAGGEVAILPAVETAIRRAFPDAAVTRIDGETRYETSKELAAAEEYSKVVGVTDIIYQGFGLLDDTDGELLVVDLIDPITIDVAVDGALDMQSQAVTFTSYEFLDVYVLLDYDGPDRFADVPENVDALLATSVAYTFGEAGPQHMGARHPVAAGSHELRMVFVYVGNEDTVEDVVDASDRHLSAEFIPYAEIEVAPYTSIFARTATMPGVDRRRSGD